MSKVGAWKEIRCKCGWWIRYDDNPKAKTDALNKFRKHIENCKTS